MVDEMERSPGSRFDVALIGAGQAGLTIGYFLAEQGRRFTILEASDSIGADGAVSGTHSCFSPHVGTTAFLVSRCPATRMDIPVASR